MLDSRCSPHICVDRRSFADYEAYDEEVVKMVNNTTNKIVGKGSIRFHLLDGRRVKVTNVRHDP